MGSYYLRQWHLRWFADRIAAGERVAVRDLSDEIVGFSLSGPRSRDVLARATHAAYRRPRCPSWAAAK